MQSIGQCEVDRGNLYKESGIPTNILGTCRSTLSETAGKDDSAKLSWHKMMNCDVWNGVGFGDLQGLCGFVAGWHGSVRVEEAPESTLNC